MSNRLIKGGILRRLENYKYFVTFLYKLVTKDLPLIYERTPSNSRKD
ncbi:MAG: hypothetical protein RLZZ402_2047 [Bacteroidota bacterium]|jgi:hypothetical protein